MRGTERTQEVMPLADTERKAPKSQFPRCLPSLKEKLLDLEEPRLGRRAPSNTDPLMGMGDAEKGCSHLVGHTFSKNNFLLYVEAVSPEV